MLNIKGALVRNSANPEIGPGRILGSDNRGRLNIRLLWQENSYAIDTANASLERYVLFGFVPVKFVTGPAEEYSEGFALRSLDSDPRSLWTYEVAVKSGDDWIKTAVEESDLTPLPPKGNHQIEHFQTLAWQSPKRFFGRWKMLLIESGWEQDSGGIPAFLGARINPMGHQLYAARRVLWDRIPRFILADEVGLGKTIEAGLIIQALKAEKPDLRVLVITPGSMARQWQTELYLRFGAQAYGHVDSSSLQNITKADWKNVLTNSNLIVTATALQTFTEARQILARQRWDLVIIDEAHQFPPGTEFYSFLHNLASTCHGLLALSATPSKREITSLAGLLALVSPEVYKSDDHESMSRRIGIQREVWDRLSFTSKYVEAAHNEGTALNAEDLSYLAEQWEGLLSDDEIVRSLVSDIKGGRATAVDDLVAYVQEFHRLDHRIIRTRRITLEEAKHHWSERAFELIEYPPDSDEAVLASHLEQLSLLGESNQAQLALRGLYSRVFNTTPSFLLAFLKERQKSLDRFTDLTLLDPIRLLSADPGPSDEELLIRKIVQSASPLPDEANWLSIAVGLAENWKEQRPIPARTLAACRWLRQHLDESPKHQVLLFAQDKAVVVELTRALQSILTDIPVKSFHHGISEPELAKVALQFQKNKDCRVLVSDELGGEGRNFQNASALMHFDLPWSVSRLEQRIGRLDRVGRGADRPVKSVVLYGPSPMEQAILAVHSGVFKVLTQSVGGIEYALPRFQRDLNQAICRGTEHVRELTNSLTAQVEDELHNVDEAFELSLDASKRRIAEAQKLAEWLNEENDSKDKDQTLAGWAKRLGVNTRKQRDDTWEFKWTTDELQRPVKTLRTNGFMTGTFERVRALTDDTQQFFSPGHPLVNALISDLHGSAEGRATVMFLELGANYRGRLFALMICRCNLDDSALQELDVSPGLILRAERFLSPEIQPSLFELHVDQIPSAAHIGDPRLMAALRSPTELSTRCKLVRPNQLNEGLDNVRGLWASAEEAITLALEYVKELRKGITEKASDRLGEDLRFEISYLTWLHKHQSVEQAHQTKLEIEARKVLIDSVRREKINLEAVAIIVAS